MSNCTNCKSHRIASVLSKASDLSVFRYKTIEHDGYLPYNIGIGGGDYCQFDYCLDCGMIQSDFPISDEAIGEALELDEMPEFADTSTPELKIIRFSDLHELAVEDVEGMSKPDWEEYRQLGNELVELNALAEKDIIK